MTDNSFQAFGQKLRGELIEPDHQCYDTARKLYNGMIDRRPRAIARCADVSDVLTAVHFTRARVICCSPCAVEVTTAAASGRVMMGW